VIGVIQSDREELRWRDRKGHFNLGELANVTHWLDVDPIWIGQDMNILAADFTIKEFIT
jgi:hypothetical protein